MKDARPTSGKVLQALFNILGDIRECSFLDLFSGTGRVARFAGDRGASPVAAVEILGARAAAIKKLFRNDRDAIILSMDVRRGLSWLRKKGYVFDIIFADPPYSEGWPLIMGDILTHSGGSVLAQEGIIVIEHSIREEVKAGDELVITDRREYGETVLTFLTRASRGGEA